VKNLIPSYILVKSKENKFKGQFKATTMFIDISGFTAMTQELMKNGKEGAEILSEIINDIYTPSIKAVYDYNGFITTFAGDAFTSVFPYIDSKPVIAIQAANQVQEIFQKIGKQKTKFSEFDLSVKIGLSYGTVNWGIIRSKSLNSYFFRGKAIDACAKSEHNAERGEIIIDKILLHKTQNKATFEVRSKDHFLLNDIVKDKGSKHLKKRTKQASPKGFVPDIILKLKSKGEFRDIISCFISFEENRDWRKAVSQILKLSSIYGGYFNKIDFGDKGGNILVLFGAPVGKEKIFKRASDFALALQNLDSLNCRIGLTFGTVFSGFVGSNIRSEYTAMGIVVNLSARFMMKAGFGEIFIDRYIFKHIKNSYIVVDKGNQKFKGFQDKIPVFVLKRRIENKTIFDGKLIGRQKELQKLKRALRQM